MYRRRQNYRTLSRGQNKTKKKKTFSNESGMEGTYLLDVSNLQLVENGISALK
jgi:hypothetical protein